LCIFCYCGSLAAQRVEPFKGKNGKYGLVKIRDDDDRFVERKVIVKPKFDSIVCYWTTNIIKVKRNDKWGFIDTNDKKITPIKYDLCRVFSDGFAAVKLNGKWGYVDTNGKEKILLGNYDDIGLHFRQIVNDEVFYWYSPEWELSQIFIGNLIIAKLNGKYGLIDTNENIVVPYKYDGIELGVDYIPVWIGDKYWQEKQEEDEEFIPAKWGIINKKGEEFLQVIYDYIDTDRDSIFIVELDGKQGIIDFNGKEVATLKWDECHPLYLNKTKTNVKLNEKYGLVENYTEKEILPIKYDAIRQTSKEHLFWVKLNGKFGLIDTAENIIIPFKYTDIRLYSNGYSISDTFKVELGDKWGMIDIDEREIIPIKYDFIAYRWMGSALVLSVSLDEKYGIIDRAGKEITPIKYDKEVPFYGENYAIVEINEKYGIVDTAGNEILPVKYDDCRPINENLTLVELDEERFLVKNNTQENILPIKCKKLSYVLDTNKFVITCDRERFFIDKTSYEIIASTTLNDYQYTILAMLSDYIYGTHHIFSDDCIAVKINSKWEIVNNMQEKIASCKYKKRITCENCATIIYEHEKVAAKKTKKGYKCYVQKSGWGSQKNKKIVKKNKK